MECDDAKSKWAVDHGLKLCGQYFQGFVDDYEAALSHRTIETVTSYGVRRSRGNAGGSSLLNIFCNRALRRIMSLKMSRVRLTRFLFKSQKVN